MGLFDKIKKKRFDVERELEQIRNAGSGSPTRFRVLLENRIIELRDMDKHNHANELSEKLMEMNWQEKANEFVIKDDKLEENNVDSIIRKIDEFDNKIQKDSQKESDEEYEEYLRKSGVFKGMTPEEAFESVSNSRKEFFKQDDVDFTVNCGTCGHLIADEPKDYDQQIQCPKCNSVNHVDRAF